MVFVFPLQMGIGGVALASAIGMVIQVIVEITHFLGKNNQLKFIKPKHIVSSVGQIISNGIPSFLMNLQTALLYCFLIYRY